MDDFDPLKYGKPVQEGSFDPLKYGKPIPQQVKQEPALEPVGMHPVEWAAESVRDLYSGAKNWLTEPQEPKDVSTEEAIGSIGGGAIGGAAFNMLAPTALKTAGKFILGMPGKVVSGMGEAWGKVPITERAVRGAGGGAGMGAAQVVSESQGAPKSVQLAAELAGSGIGEAGASFLTKEIGQMLKVAGMAAYGSPHGAAYAVKGMLDPNKKMNEQMAKNLQKDLFGNKIDGYVEGLTQSDFMSALQESIRLKDKSVPRGIPASAYYRDNLFSTITDATEKGNLFSNSTAFEEFLKSLNVKRELGQVSRTDANNLIRSLKADSSHNPDVLKGYAENLDNQIREWAASSEKGAVTGAKAIVTKTDLSVRADLQKAVNEYLASMNKPPLETLYRQTYRAEKLAQSKDTIPYLISKYGSESSLERVAGDLVKDTETKPFLIDSIKKHLANTEPKDVANEFGRLDKLLIKTEMFDLKNAADRATLQSLKNESELITKTATKGEQISRANRFKRVLLRTLGQKGSVESGKEIARMTQSEQPENDLTIPYTGQQP